MTAQEIAGRLLLGELTHDRVRHAKSLADTGPQRGQKGQNIVPWADVLACFSDDLKQKIEALDAQ